ncbi:MAG: flagellar export protein FliJ [Burkholderiales bacterium]|nr:flagellar export protein FliJ [Burkholderiales bacterium]
MARHEPIELLISLAKDRAEDAGRRLGQLIHRALGTEQTLAVLQGYRTEYVAKYGEAMRAGVDVGALHNFRSFLGTLDEIIRQQAAQVDESRRAVGAGTQAWHAESRRLKSFSTLADRQRAAARIADARSEQKHHDEFAARRLTANRER